MHQFGGYAELAPDHSRSLMNGDEWNFSFKYVFERHAPVNVSWGPMGTFLKLKDGQTVEVFNEPLKFLNGTTRKDTSNRSLYSVLAGICASQRNHRLTKIRQSFSRNFSTTEPHTNLELG